MHCISILRSILISLFLTGALTVSAGEPDKFALKDGQTVVFVGDSNTYADQFIQYLDAYLFTRFPDKHFHLINRGMPSETVAGTSEPTHQPPRPDLHTRFSRTVPPLNPDLVVACYGMNDGIYLPPNEETFAKYRDGIEWLIMSVRQETHASLTLLTPPPFDPLPYESKPVTDPPDWRRPASDYDSTLTQFSKWLLTWRKEGMKVVDIHLAVHELLRARRLTEPQFILASDGVHLGPTGHWLMAQEILRAWRAPSLVAKASVSVSTGKASPGISNFNGIAAGPISFDWAHPLPMPLDPNWDTNMLVLADTTSRFDRLTLRVAGLRAPRYILRAAGVTVATLDKEMIEAGLDLNRYPAFPDFDASREVLTLVQKRRLILRDVWVRSDPHPRLAGMAEATVTTLEDADALETRIRQLCQPPPMRIELIPAGP